MPARQGNSGTQTKYIGKYEQVVEMEEAERYMYVHVRHKFGKLGFQLGNIICGKVPCYNWAWLIWPIQCGVVGFHNEWKNVRNRMYFSW